jgi:tripartite-type tricarboxylate transporter receptor subunit TctC
LGVKSLKELIALAKSKPGELNFSSAGNGSGLHLTGELFKLKAGIDIVHVPYPGAAQSLTDLMPGRVQMGFYPAEAVLGLAKDGRVVILAVASATRSVVAPDIPTMAEAGLPGVEASGWYGILVPSKTPDAILDTLHDALLKAINTKETHDRLLASGYEPKPGSRQEFTDFINSELKKWGEVAQAANIKLD